MKLLAIYIFLIVITEAITQLAIKSIAFEPLRVKIQNWCGNKHPRILYFTQCGYCFSVWASGLVVAISLILSLIPTYHYPLFFVFFGNLLFVHRASNILHNVIDKHTDKRYDSRYNSENFINQP
jgi:hypothetical protein